MKCRLEALVPICQSTRRYQTPLKPSKLQNIASLQYSSKNTRTRSKAIKLSQSIMLADCSQSNSNHFNSTFECTIRRHNNNSQFQKLLHQTGCKLTQSIVPEGKIGVGQCEYLSKICDREGESQYVMMRRSMLRQLVNSEWVCHQTKMTSPPRAMGIKKHPPQF